MTKTATVSQADLAKLTGFSRLTVSRALRGDEKVSPETRAAIARLADQHGYRPNAAARAMRGNQTHQIGVLLCNSPSRPFDNPSSMEMLVGINNRVAVEDYIVVLVRIADIESTLAKDSRVFSEQAVDGMIVSGAMSNEVIARIRQLIPNCLFVDTNINEPNSCIQRDEFTAGQLAARAVLQAGYKHIVWTGSRVESNARKHYHYSLFQRYQGILSVIQGTGIDVSYCDAYHGVDEPESWGILVNHVRENLARPDTAVITYNTSSAGQWAHAALELGLMPGRDFGLACCDSSYAICIDWPGLSRTLFDRFDMGIQAAEMMIRMLKHPEFQCTSRKLLPQWHQGTTLRQAH